MKQEQAFVGSPWGPNPASWPGVAGVAGETNFLPYVKNPYLPDPMNAGMQPSAPGLIGGARKKKKSKKAKAGKANVGKAKKKVNASKKKSSRAKAKAKAKADKKQVAKYLCRCVSKTQPKYTCKGTSNKTLKCIATKQNQKNKKGKKSKKGTQQKGGMRLGNISFAIKEAYNTAVGQETPINADPDPRVQPIGQKGDYLIVGGNIDVPNAYLSAQKTAGSM